MFYDPCAEILFLHHHIKVCFQDKCEKKHGQRPQDYGSVKHNDPSALIHSAKLAEDSHLEKIRSL